MFIGFVITYLTPLSSGNNDLLPNKFCRQKSSHQIFGISFKCTTVFPNFNHSGLVHTSTPELFCDAHMHASNFALPNQGSCQKVPHSGDWLFGFWILTAFGCYRRREPFPWAMEELESRMEILVREFFGKHG